MLSHRVAIEGSRLIKETGKVKSGKRGNNPFPPDRLEYTTGGCGTPAKGADLIGGLGTLPFVQDEQRKQSIQTEPVAL